MKKLIIILLIVTLLPNITEAKGIVLEHLDSVETSLFGYDYKGEDDSKRIERIESYLYGQKKSGNLQTRFNDIQNDIGYTYKAKESVKPAASEQTSLGQQAPSNREVKKVKEDSNNI